MIIFYGFDFKCEKQYSCHFSSDKYFENKTFIKINNNYYKINKKSISYDSNFFKMNFNMKLSI